MHSIGSCVCANAFSDARDYNKRFHGTRYTSGWLAHDNKHRWTDPERCHPWCSICAKIYLKIHHVYWDMCEIQAQTARLVFLQPSLQLLVSAMHLALLRCESNSSRKLFAFCPNWTALAPVLLTSKLHRKSAWTALLSLNSNKNENSAKNSTKIPKLQLASLA